MLAGRGDAIHRYYVILARQTAFTVLLTLTAVLTLYMVIRSGPSVSFMIETHLTPPICAIVLCYTPLSYCRKAIDAFILVAVLNSSIGIVEAIGKFRIFHFDPGWSVMNEPQFRASASIGHPLNNAMFTSVALFVALALRIPPLIKALVVAIFLASLVAFGGRFGLAYSVSGCLAYGLIMLVSILKKGSLTLAQALLLLTAAILVPVVIVGGIFLLVNSSIGERIAAHAQWDESADGRATVLVGIRLYEAR